MDTTGDRAGGRTAFPGEEAEHPESPAICCSAQGLLLMYSGQNVWLKDTNQSLALDARNAR